MVKIKFSKHKDTKDHRGAYITELHTFSNRKFRRELIFLREDMLEDIRFLNYQQYIFERDYDRNINNKIDKKTNETIEIPFSGITGKWTAGDGRSPIHFVYCVEQNEEKKHNFSSIDVFERPLMKFFPGVIKYEVLYIPQFKEWYSPKELMMCGELIFRKGENIQSSFSKKNITHVEKIVNLKSNLIRTRMEVDSIEVIEKW